MADDENKTKTVIIKILDTEQTHRFAGSTVPVAVNGTIARIPFNEETEVGEHITGALTDAGIPFTVVESKGSTGSVVEGVSITDPLKLVVPADDPAKSQGEGADPAKSPQELKQDPGKVHVETDIEASKLTTGEGGGGTTLADTGTGTNANGTPGEASKTGETSKTDGDAEPGLLDSNITDLKEALKGVTDVAEIDKLLAAEKAGKSRAGATDALEARKAELTAA